MTRFLVATASVHTTAAACDYLSDRLGAGDEVVVLAVVGGDVGPRDAGDALNVAPVRLPEADVETVEREGDPGTEILDCAAERAVDEVVIGARRAAPDGTTAGLGGTAGDVLASADRPVVVLPAAAPG